MKLTREKALELLEEARKEAINDAWIDHSICVGYVAGVIAKALNLDEEKAQTLGYIHDIGKKVGPFHLHIINGYYYLKKLGYDEEYCSISLVHSYLNNNAYCTAGGIPKNEKLKNYIKNHDYTIYDKIINLSDLMCTDKICTLEKRLIDVIIRYGIFENTKYHIEEACKLKSYFDKKLGYNLYDLFDEIKENL